jgi:hypothetical protein
MRRVSVLLAALILPVSSMAAWFSAEFSADAVQLNPQTKQWQPVGKIYAGKDKLRLEAVHGNQTQVLILDVPKHTTYLINPAERSYMEVKGMLPGVPTPATVTMPNDPTSPCQQGQMTCKKLGEEKIDGTTLEKWEFVFDHQGKQLRSVQWLDPQRKVVLRQENPGGATIERKLLGQDTLNGREVEKWQVTVQQGNQTQQATEWVDPRLNVAVRIEQRGQGQELRNIQVGTQPDKLFVVPQDYQKRVPQQGSAGPGMPGGGPGTPSTAPGMQRSTPPVR